MSDDTFYLYLRQIVINPRPEFPLDRVVISTDEYAIVEEKGLLTTPGSVLENIQFAAKLNGLRRGFHVKKQSFAPIFRFNCLEKSKNSLRKIKYF